MHSTTRPKSKVSQVTITLMSVLGCFVFFVCLYFSGPLFGFTKANELFVGRLAQLGFAFSLIGEIITGKGALAQLNIETGVPINEIEPLVLFSVVFFFFAAVNPGNGKFVTDEDDEDS